MKLTRIVIAALVLLVATLSLVRWVEYRERSHNEQLLSELAAADAVRASVASYPVNFALESRTALDFSSVESLVRQLSEAKRLERPVAEYVLSHRSRFAVRKTADGIAFDARWIFDDTAL